MGPSSRRRRRERSPSEEYHHRRRRSRSRSRRRRRDEESEEEEERLKNRSKKAAFGATSTTEDESEDHAGGVSLTSIMKENPKLSVQEALAKLVIMKQMSGAPLQMGGAGVAMPQLPGVQTSLPGILPGASPLVANNPAAAAALAAASMPAALQQNKTQREVYVKNLPSGVTAAQVQEFLTTVVTTLGQKPKREAHTWLSADGTIAFCEAKTVDDAKAIVECCDGIDFAGNRLEVGRPKEAISSQDAVDPSIATQQTPQQLMPVSHTLMLINIPRHLTAAEIQESLILPFGDIKVFNMLLDQQGKSKGSVVFRYADEKRASKAIAALSSSPSSPGVKLGDEKLEIQRVPPAMVDTLLKPVKPGELVPTAPHDPTRPSQILCIRDLVNDQDLSDEQAHTELVDELLEECTRYATVLHLLVPRLDIEPCKINKKNKNMCSGLGLVFVEYSSIDEATDALWSLRNRTVDDRPINVSYYPRDLYKKEILHSPPIQSLLDPQTPAEALLDAPSLETGVD